jgi:hypothetical protein
VYRFSEPFYCIDASDAIRRCLPASVSARGSSRRSELHAGTDLAEFARVLEDLDAKAALRERGGETADAAAQRR